MNVLTERIWVFPPRVIFILLGNKNASNHHDLCVENVPPYDVLAQKLNVKLPGN